MQFFYRFDHDEMNFNAITNCIIGIKIYEILAEWQLSPGKCLTRLMKNHRDPQ